MPRTVTVRRQDEAAAALETLAAAKELSLAQISQVFRSGADVVGGGNLHGPASAFRQVSWVYACIRAIAENAARVPIRLSRGEAAGTRGAWGLKHVRGGPARRRAICREKSVAKAQAGEIVEAGELYELLARPNPEQTWKQFCQTFVGLLYDQGRVHWLFDEMVGRRPVTMYVVGGRATKPVVDKSGRIARLVGWSLRDPHGAWHPIALEEVLTFQMFNPDDPRAGLAPRTPGNLAIVSDYNAARYNAAMFGNSAEPGGVLRTDAPFDPELDAQLKTAWEQRHAGAANAKRIAVLWGGLTWERVATTMHDMQFADGRRMSREEMSAVFRVPLSVVGVLGTTGRSSAFVDNELKRFWQDTEAPLLDEIAEAINVHLAPRFVGGLTAWADIEDVPIYQELRNQNIKAIDSLWAKGVPMADLADLYDLGLPARPWHEQGFLPLSITTAGDLVAGSVEPNVPEGPTTPGADELDQEQAAGARAQGSEDSGQKTEVRRPEQLAIGEQAAKRLWQAFVRSFSPLTRRMRGMLRVHFDRQRKRVVKVLRELLPAGRSPETAARSAGADAKDAPILARILLALEPTADDAGFFRSRVKVLMTDASELGVRQALTEAGLSGEALEDGARAVVGAGRIPAAVQSDAVRISTLVDNRTRVVLRQSLTEGLAAGEDLRKLADRVQDVTAGRRAQAMSIARNTVGQAISRARAAGRRGSGLTHEVWISSRGPGERRPAHVAAEAHYAKNPKPIGEPWLINGKRLAHPRDHGSGYLEETVNCQCLAIGRRRNTPARQAAADLLAGGFVTWADVEAARAGHPATKENDHE